jgi:hypothetical protein
MLNRLKDVFGSFQRHDVRFDKEFRAVFRKPSRIVTLKRDNTDKSTRNLIQKATQDARHLLETEFSPQLEGVFGILARTKHCADSLISHKICAFLLFNSIS